MRVAVTGASGFLGRHLATELASRGHSSLPLRRGADGRLVPPAPNDRADALVHLAFPTDATERRARPLETLTSVVRAAADAVSSADRLGCTHLVLASTGKVYGRPETLPIADATPPRPTTQLGELKLLAERVFAAAAGTGKLGATSLRIFNAYGPDQPATFLVPTLLAGVASGRLVLGELDHARDWIHATDVARAIVAAIEAPPGVGAARAFNVATGEARSVRELLAMLRELGVAVPEPTVDETRLRAREATEERAGCEGLRALGWSPRVGLRDGLGELVARALR